MAAFETAPRLDFEAYFAGRSRAWGLVRDRFGTVRRRFTVALLGAQEGDVFTLAEDFVFLDGETQRRVWRVRRLGADRLEGEADDVVGTATGTTRDGAVNWRYTLALPIGGRRWHVRFDDWMYAMPDGRLLNRARMHRFGVTLGEILIAFEKER